MLFLYFSFGRTENAVWPGIYNVFLVALKLHMQELFVEERQRFKVRKLNKRKLKLE